MKKLFLLALFLAGTMSAAAQGVPRGFDLSNYGVRIEPDRRVMIVLATIEAGRTTDKNGQIVPVIKTPLSEEGVKFRDQLTSDLAALDEKLRDRISAFLIRHKQVRPKATDAELIAPFISMAYALTPAPELADPVITTDLPGSLLDVLDFAPLVRDFYRLSSFSANLEEYVADYREASDGKLRSSSSEMVTELLSYLKTRPQIFIEERTKTETQKGNSKKTKIQNIEVRTRERKFTLVPEMLAPVGIINFVNVKDDYYVVLPPDTDVSFSDVRRAYLQFVIDPLILKHASDVAFIRDGVKQILDEQRKKNASISPDVFLTVSRSLVAAIDAKQLESERVQIATDVARQKITQAKTEADKLAVSAELAEAKQSYAEETAIRLAEDYSNGAVLVYYFSDQLGGVEGSGFDIAASIREMLLSFDPALHADRVAKYEAAKQNAVAAREKRGSAPIVVIRENPVTTRLLAIQDTIKARNFSQAEQDLKALLSEHPGEPRIFYNIGRVASLSAESIEDEEQLKVKLLEAKVAYENVIRIAEKQWADAAAGIAVAQPIDPALVSISYVALGKIYEFYDEEGYAMGIYDKAIKMGDIAGGSFKEAMAAKQRLMNRQ